MSKRLASGRVVGAGSVARLLMRQTGRTHMEQIERSEVERAAETEASHLERLNLNDRWSEREGERITAGFRQLQASDYLTGNERWES